MNIMEAEERIRTLSHRQRHFLCEKLTEISYSRYLREGDSAIDCGANIGHHTRLLSKVVGPGGRVHAFEPNPALFKGLLALGTNIRLWPFAAGDELQICRLHIPEGLIGWASLEDIRGLLPDRSFRLVTTAQVRIDDLVVLAAARPRDRNRRRHEGRSHRGRSIARERAADEPGARQPAGRPTISSGLASGLRPHRRRHADQRAAVGCQSRRRGVERDGEPLERLTGPYVPEADLTGGAHGHQGPTVAAEHHGAHAVGVAAQLTEPASGGGVPDSDDPVVGGRRQPAAVR